MSYIDPHIHMVSRTTDDYHNMAQAGCVAISEPAFWPGFDRQTAQGFYDYFNHLTSVEPRRAALYGIKHYAWLCINPKEAEDVGLAREVIALIPEFLTRANVLGIGEVGLNKNSRNEVTVLEEQVALAVKYHLPIIVHTPHLEDKLKGTRLIMDAITNNSKMDPADVLIDHVEEHTMRAALDRGFWAGISMYPNIKGSPARAVDLIENFGVERVCLNSSSDWGPSDPLAIPKARVEFRLRGHSDELFAKCTFSNPVAFLSKSKNFQVPKYEKRTEA